MRGLSIFFALAKTLSNEEFAVVIECALQRKAKKRKKDWEKKGYELQDPVESMSHIVQVNQWFRVGPYYIILII